MSGGSPSGAHEGRAALVIESRDAFPHLRPAQRAKFGEFLRTQSFVEVKVCRLVNGRLRIAIGFARAGRESLCESKRFLNQLVLREDAVEETDAVPLGGINELGREDQFESLRGSDELGQQIGATGDAAPGEDVGEARLL